MSLIEKHDYDVISIGTIADSYLSVQDLDRIDKMEVKLF